MITNKEIANISWETLKPHLGIAVVATLIIMAVTGLSQFIGFGIITLLITGPLGYGSVLFFKNLAQGKQPDVNDLFEGFRGGKLVNLILLGVLSSLIIGFGFILLIVPGIIAALALSQIYFIMIDSPDLSAVDAMKASRDMMEDNKTNLFMLWVRFIPWVFLCILTLFLGFFILSPWMQTSFANFYLELVGDESSPIPAVKDTDFLDKDIV